MLINALTIYKNKASKSSTFQIQKHGIGSSNKRTNRTNWYNLSTQNALRNKFCVRYVKWIEQGILNNIFFIDCGLQMKRPVDSGKKGVVLGRWG